MLTAPQSKLSYQDREKIKQFAYQGEALTECMILLMHFEAQNSEPCFSVFASEWAECWDDHEAAAPIKKWWPLSIASGA